LPEDEYSNLLPHLEPIDLPQGQVLYLQDSNIEEVYFPTRGMVSLVLASSEGDTI